MRESQSAPIEISIHEIVAPEVGAGATSHGSGSEANTNSDLNAAAAKVPAPDKRSSRARLTTRKPHRPEVVAHLHLIDLMPGATQKRAADNAADSSARSSDQNSAEPADESPGQFLLGGGQGRQLALYNYIYRILEPHVIFPEELRTRGIHGSVAATVIFSPDGEYLRSASTFSSDNNYIKVLVIKTLRDAFRENLNANFLKDRKRIEIRCQFEYAITEHDDALLEARRNYVAGNNLKFYRHFQSSVLSWEVGPLHGWGVFPALDIGWFAGLVQKKHETDPLEFYREDPEW